MVELLDPPALWLPNVLDMGQTESWSVAGARISATLEAVGQESSVPAGTFGDGIRLRWNLSSDEDSWGCTIWSAPEVGSLKEERAGSLDGESTEETPQLVAAVIDGALIGTPLVEGDPWSESPTQRRSRGPGTAEEAYSGSSRMC